MSGGLLAEPVPGMIESTLHSVDLYSTWPEQVKAYFSVNRIFTIK
jgi:hypothetical protein